MRTALSALAIAALSIGCEHYGSVHVTLTDAPATASIKQVLITVNEVRVHDDAETTGSGGDAGATADGATGVGWIVLCTDTQTFDLLQLTGGKAAPLCGDRKIDLIAGHITQLRLGVKAATLVLDGGATQPLDVPSGAQSGLKIEVNRDVQANSTLSLALDFNANDSLSQDGNGTWKLKPVIHLLP